MVGVFEVIDAEGDKTTTQNTSNTSNPTAREPGESSRMVLGSSEVSFSTVRAGNLNGGDGEKVGRLRSGKGGQTFVGRDHKRSPFVVTLKAVPRLMLEGGGLSVVVLLLGGAEASGWKAGWG